MSRLLLSFAITMSFLAVYVAPAFAQGTCVDSLSLAISTYRSGVAHESFTALVNGKDVRGNVSYHKDIDEIVVNNLLDREILTLFVKKGEIERGKFQDGFGSSRPVNVRNRSQLLLEDVRYEDVALLSFSGFLKSHGVRDCFSEDDEWKITLVPKKEFRATYDYQTVHGKDGVVTSRRLYNLRGGAYRLMRTLEFTGHYYVGTNWRPRQILIREYKSGRVRNETHITNIAYELKRR